MEEATSQVVDISKEEEEAVIYNILQHLDIVRQSGRMAKQTPPSISLPSAPPPQTQPQRSINDPPTPGPTQD
ncbi:hypothetical protein SLS53_001502 [Cytospora paraplurivora]|uniref:Uncharacterized protein n=1 Tax=Cytospora paraplurivora TaxID=2898453 RepID=A0AAN9UFA8_9PEZI